MRSLTEKLIVFADRHKTGCLAAAILLGLLAGISLLRIHFTNDVSRMFPDSRDAGTTFRILNETNLGNTVQLEFISTHSIGSEEKYLDSVAAKLKTVPGIRNLVFRYRTGDPLDEIASFTALLPRFFGPEILKQCDAGTAAKNALKQLAFPTPGGLKLLRLQPFSPCGETLSKLSALDEMTGMKIAPDLPFFASRDRRRAMLVFDADIRIGDAAAVRKLLKQIRLAAEPLPPGMQLRVISGIMHTLGNEEVLKRDAAISGTVSLLLFLLIFAFCYRGDWRALWIPAIPLYASLLALGIMTCFFREICLYVIGLGSCITGLAVDQGIHVYAAFRGDQAERRTAALTEPMMLSAGTSILVFIFLAFTGISAYIQLAVFAGLSLAFSCLIALVILPLLLKRGHNILDLKMNPPKRGFSALFLIPLVPVLIFCGKVLLANADFSLDSLDGTPEKIRAEEADFNRAWRSSGTKTAVIAASGDTEDEALSRLLRIADKLSVLKIPVAVPPVPPASEQQINRIKWRTAETAKQIDARELQTRLACRKHHLPEPFFQPFFDQLRSAIRGEKLDLPPILSAVMKKMVKKNGAKASAIAMLPDTENNARAARKILKDLNESHCALLSKEGFKQMVREDLGGRFLWILPLSILSALLLAYAVFRNIGDVLLAMVPVFIAFSGLFILGDVTRFKATPAAAFALILLTGLAIDYGIYAVSQLRHPDQISIRGSIFLSAATTVAGAGALVFSKHPALFGTGVVLSIGISLACLSGLCLVPMLKKSKTSSVLPAVFLLFLLTGCASGIRFEDFPEAENLRQRMKLYPENRFKIQANARLEAGDRNFTFILTADLDPASGRLKAAGISGAGTLIFMLDNDKIRLGTGIPEQTRKYLEALRRDLTAIFLSVRSKPLYVEDGGSYIAVKDEDGCRWKLYPDRVIRERTSYPVRSWTCEYQSGGREINFRSRRGYAIRLKIVRIQGK